MPDDAEIVELFPDFDFGCAPVAGGCAKPIGRQREPRRRRPRAPPPTTAAMLTALRLTIERQHAEIIAELRQIGRDESMPAVLRQLVELRRGLGLTELHIPAKASRRRPLGNA